MIKYLAFTFLMTLMAASGPQGERQGLHDNLVHDNLVKVGLDRDPAPAASSDAAGCDEVTFTRGLKYGGDSLNVLDVATAQTRPGAKRPVIVFVANDSFAGDGKTAALSALIEQAMCFAGRNGLVAFNVSYRLAPAAPWPAGAKDVAAAISWVHENADLFGGNKQEIIPVGYAAGAFHVASFLAHREFQDVDSSVAGAVLVSGIYRPGADADDGEKSYFGGDTSKYDGESALPGLTKIDLPLVVAWSPADAPRFVTEGEKLKELLCSVGHCPRFALLNKPGSPVSVFDLDGASRDLHERVRQLIGQLDARGLP